MNDIPSYKTLSDLPDTLAVFPLSGALLLPRSQLPLNIFEPRYLHMVNDALAGSRLIGMIQPHVGSGGDVPLLQAVGCVGKITSFSETGDGRYAITLTGICRFGVEEELHAMTAYRQVKADYSSYGSDLDCAHKHMPIDRTGLLKTFSDYLAANGMEADWESIDQAGDETLVNALCCMSPYGVDEKQALLEATDLSVRAAMLIALTELLLARDGDDSSAPLQ